MEEEKGLITYTCDECGKVIETYYDDGIYEIDEFGFEPVHESLRWLSVTLTDVLRVGTLFNLTHRSYHLCEDCKEKIIYKAKEALMELGFEEDEEV